MKYRKILSILALAAVVSVSLAACRPVRPRVEMESQRGIQGELHIPGVEPWGGVTVSMDVDVQETDAAAHTASGHVNWRNYQPDPPEGDTHWRAVDADARYVFFGADEENGDPNAAVVIAQLKRQDGWGQGEPGEYAYFWLRDGGSEGADQWGMRYFSLDPWYEFYPAAAPPVADGYFTVEEMQADDAVLPLDVEVGGVTITR